jgi:uncharacterized damage-inducible protein DinB
MDRLCSGLQKQFTRLAHYNHWMNERLYALAAQMSDEERKLDRGAFFKSIHGTLNHILLGDRIWLARFASSGHAFAALKDHVLPLGVTALGDELYTDFTTLTQERSKTDLAIEAWMAELDDAILDSTLRYKRMNGEAHEHPFWLVLTHFFNHQTHHRGQVTTLFMQSGRDPGVTDFIALP